MRKPTVPVLQTDVGGGVWRVRWHPDASRKHDLLVACMHDGFKVLRFSGTLGASAEGGEEGAASILRRFDEHKSLAYGVDWSFAEPNRSDETAIASCSFYDHLLHVWRG
jgi:diphthamide biosynthesis protein 7